MSKKELIEDNSRHVFHDIKSFALVLMELVTGDEPYQHLSEEQKKEEIDNNKLPECFHKIGN